MRVPPLSVPDKESVNERFTSNMLYYQTNYFLVTAVLIGINLILSPISVLVGSCTLTFAVALCNNLDSWWPFASRPSNVVIYAIVCTAILLYMLPMMTPTILCLASISLVIMLHALLRQRNMMNKVTRLLDANAPDRYRSPMGLLLGKYGE
ncbi:PRA1 family protein [Echinococcus granulosus]|uniref:PRA1 family protein n=1 Tax=Echinococcus granulosus TaxID=6210 RepID=W6UQL6_ECHGR|nr:PRA1 family protein [Echinococcus granulosus]EUB63508.1 PRA1 family protein [Echinococcus granulosus]